MSLGMRATPAIAAEDVSVLGATVDTADDEGVDVDGEYVDSPNAADEMLERTCLLDLNDAYAVSSALKMA